MNIIEKLHTIGFLNTVRNAFNFYSGKIFRKMFHRRLTPTLFDMSNIFESLFFFDEEKFIAELCELNQTSLLKIKDEFMEIYDYLSRKRFEVKLTYPDDFDTELGTLFTLYSFIRVFQPEQVVETGVANGQSSFAILKAMELNNKGKLISIDISTKVGNLIDNELKSRWELKVLRHGTRKEFQSYIDDLEKIDLFYHDSNHSYKWQSLEYHSSFQKLNSRGILFSDDVDLSYAFIDFVTLSHSG